MARFAQPHLLPAALSETFAGDKIVKPSRLLICLVFACSVACICGYSKSDGSKTPFIHRNAVFQASSGGDGATSPVEKPSAENKTHKPQSYRGGMLLNGGAIKVRYEFVGTAFCPVTLDGKEWNDVDVYVLNITEGSSITETLPFIYKGGAVTVIDRPRLKITMHQE